MTIFSAPPNSEIIDADVDSNNRVSALLRAPAMGLYASFGGKHFPLLTDEFSSARHIRWIDSTQCLLWPVFNERSKDYCVVVISPLGFEVVDTILPYKAFSDNGFIIFLYSDERISNQVPFASVVYGKALDNIIKITSELIGVYPTAHGPLIEMNYAAFCSENSTFWFTAYDSKRLWRFSCDTNKHDSLVLPFSRENICGMSLTLNGLDILFAENNILRIANFGEIAGRIQITSQYKVGKALSQEVVSIINRSPEQLIVKAKGRYYIRTKHAVNKISLQ